MFLRHFTRFIFCVFLLTIFTAGTCAAVTVPGHDGTQLALSQIPDIIRHVTGQTSGDLHLSKDSLYIYGVQASTNQEHEDLYSFNTDGSNNNLATLTNTIDAPAGSFDYQSIAVINSSMLRSGDKGKFLLKFFVPAEADDLGRKFATECTRITSDPDGGNLKMEQGGSYHVDGGEAGVITDNPLIDVKGGMTVKGYDREVTAYLFRNGETINVYLGDVDLSSPSDDWYTTYAEKAVSGTWSGNTGLSGNVPKMLDGTVYFPVSMAVGDFDGDGYKNEIAVVFTNRIAVRYVVLQVTHTTDASDYSSFTISTLSNGDVDSYGYGDWDPDFVARYLNMDGISCTYSLYTVAGDFDGDGKDEFAIVWRDT